MEKKIEVEIGGKIHRIAEHMLDDATRFGATVTKRQIKDIPQELLLIPDPIKVIIPPLPVPPAPKEIKVEPDKIDDPLTDPVIKKTRARRK